MNADTIVAELRAEEKRINAALLALVGSTKLIPEVLTAKKTQVKGLVPTVTHRHRMPLAVRQRLSSAMKLYWATQSKPEVLTHTVSQFTKGTVG